MVYVYQTVHPATDLVVISQDTTVVYKNLLGAMFVSVSRKKKKKKNGKVHFAAF